MPFARPVPRNQPLADGCYSDPDHAAFLTIRASGDDIPFVRAALNYAVIKALLQECRRSQCALYAYCLMPDHLHVLSSPLGDDASVLDMLRRYKGLSTRIAWRFGHSGRLWQPRWYDSVLRLNAIEDVAEYIINNPVRAGLVACADDYRWSDRIDSVDW